MSECELCKQTMFIGKCPHNRMSRMSHARDEKFEKELENDLKILALDCYDKGFKAGLKAERERSKKLVEALTKAKTRLILYLESQGIEYDGRIEFIMLKTQINEALKEYEKEGET